MDTGQPSRGAQPTLAESRSRSYWLLSGFFLTRPDPNVIDDLRARLEPARAFWSISPLLKRLADAIADREGDDLPQRLAIEYTRLFGGLREGYGPAPPYESMYRENRLHGESTMDVVRMYADAGFAVVDETIAPQDHVGVELKFMALLCNEEIGAWEQGDEAAVADLWERESLFLSNHLLAWGPDFCQRIEADSREPFYGAAAALTEAILVADAQLLSEVQAEAGFSAKPISSPQVMTDDLTG